MHDRRLGGDDRPPAADAGAVAEVDLLAVHEEARVEAAERVQSAVGIRKKQPQTMSTSRTLSRRQPPIASVSNSRLRRKAAASPVASQKALQGVSRFQQDLGFRLPSGKTVRPP